MSEDVEVPAFSGELFRTLAEEGRLVVDDETADEVIGELQRTLASIESRLRMIRIWQHEATGRLTDLPGDLARTVVDAVFAEQIAPGRLELAAVELPKYIEAFQRARRTVGPGR